MPLLIPKVPLLKNKSYWNSRRESFQKGFQWNVQKYPQTAQIWPTAPTDLFLIAGIDSKFGKLESRLIQIFTNRFGYFTVCIGSNIILA